MASLWLISYFTALPHGSKVALQARGRKTLVHWAWLQGRYSAARHELPPRSSGPDGNGLSRGLRPWFPWLPKQIPGAILTFQKSPAPSAVRKESRVRLGTRNPAGSHQDLNIINLHGGLHVDRNSRIQTSTPSLRPHTKLYGSFFTYLPHQRSPLSPVSHGILGFPQLHFRTITYLLNISSPTKPVTGSTARTLSESSTVTVPRFGAECARHMEAV